MREQYILSRWETKSIHSVIVYLTLFLSPTPHIHRFSILKINLKKGQSIPSVNQRKLLFFQNLQFARKFA